MTVVVPSCLKQSNANIGDKCQQMSCTSHMIFSEMWKDLDGCLLGWMTFIGIQRCIRVKTTVCLKAWFECPWCDQQSKENFVYKYQQICCSTPATRLG